MLKRDKEAFTYLIWASDISDEANTEIKIPDHLKDFNENIVHVYRKYSETIKRTS